MAQKQKTIYDQMAGPLESTGMEYTRLGGAGVKVSKIILGAMSYGSKEWAPWALEEDEALPLLEHAYKAGINTWDTVRYLVVIKKMANGLTLCRQTSIPTDALRSSSPRRSRFTKSRERVW